MKKWQKVFIILVAILIVAAGGAYWAMNKAVNKVLEAVSSDVVASMESPIPQATAPIAQVSASPVIAPGSSVQTEPTPGMVSSQQPSPASAQTTPGASVYPAQREEAAPTPTPSATPYDPSINADKAAKAQEEITVKEKLQITSIFMKRFSAKELDAFMKLASGGLTHEEKIEAKKLVLEKLSEDEYNQLIGIAARLGLSQGGQYSK
jgi:hypothetical protein